MSVEQLAGKSENRGKRLKFYVGDDDFRESLRVFDELRLLLPPELDSRGLGLSESFIN